MHVASVRVRHNLCSILSFKAWVDVGADAADFVAGLGAEVVTPWVWHLAGVVNGAIDAKDLVTSPAIVLPSVGVLSVR